MKSDCACCGGVTARVMVCTSELGYSVIESVCVCGGLALGVIVCK
jgi:hypothetical protein